MLDSPHADHACGAHCSPQHPAAGVHDDPRGAQLSRTRDRPRRGHAERRAAARLGEPRALSRSEPTLPAPAAGARRVVFMGDSITDAWPQPRFGDFFTGKPYVGRGISGQTTPQMLVRFRADVLDLKPAAVVILAGTNDIAGNTGPMLSRTSRATSPRWRSWRSHGIKVVLASILPTSAYHTAPDAEPQADRRPLARIRAINDVDQGLRREPTGTRISITSPHGRRERHARRGAERRRSAPERQRLHDHGSARGGGDPTGAEVARPGRTFTALGPTLVDAVRTSNPMQ